MAEIFKMDDKDLERLIKFYKKAPDLFAKAVLATLNALAFGTRKEAIKIIGSKMTVRNPGFIYGSLKVIKAKAVPNINKIISITGSVERPRYTGLAEQELGKPAKRNRVFTKAARGGDMQAPIQGWARLKPQAKYPGPNKTEGLRTKEGRSFSLQGLSGAKRIVAFLHILHEKKTAQTFILRRPLGRFKRGLYRFKQGVIKKLQSFDNRLTPKRIRWLTEARKAFVKQTNILQIWADSINYQLKKFK